jgi:hypothetical protein
LHEWLFPPQVRFRKYSAPPRQHRAGSRLAALLPLTYLHRVDLVLGDYRMDRLDALEGFQADPGFQIGTMLTSFL